MPTQAKGVSIPATMRKSYIISSAVVAIIFYGLISFSLTKLIPNVIKPSDFPYMSWTAWTIQDFLKEPKAPDIVFLGSSLMLVPIAGTDANTLQKFIDGSEHHKSIYFEHNFKKLAGLDLKTFNFSLPGEMPSDAFLITKFFLNEKKAPKLIVWGIGPRDFLDNLLPSPASTDPFRFLSRFGQLDDYVKLLMPDFFSQFDYQFGKLDYLYGHRMNISLITTNYLAKQIDKLVPLPKNTKAISVDDRRFLLPSYNAYELKPKDAFFRPLNKTDKPNFTDNIAEYRKRYKKLKWDTYLTQMEFFAKTLSVARERNIHVVLVAMPITEINRSLLNQTSWKLYKQGLYLMAKLKGASLIDLSETNQFCLNDFCDTIHLNAQGGQKLIDIVLEKTVSDQKIASILDTNSTSKRVKVAQSAKQPL
jgi:hypothetical protein